MMYYANWKMNIRAIEVDKVSQNNKGDKMRQEIFTDIDVMVDAMREYVRTTGKELCQ